MTARRLPLLVLPLVVLLGGCGDPAPDPGTPTNASPTTSPAETPTAAALDPDVLLVVSATATAENGSVLDLTMTVHTATAWDDSTGADRASLMTSTCQGYLDAGVYEANLWSFLKVDVEAVPSGFGAWPSEKRIRLFPLATDDYALASGGALVEDPDVASETPHCARDRYIYGAGESTLVVGIQGDTDAVEAAGHFTRWANTLYGFVGREVGGQTAAEAGITLTNCSFTVTPAGVELHGGADWWSEDINESDCYLGSTSP